MIRRIDRFDPLGPVGPGEMSVVYRGRDAALDLEVAVKILHPLLAHHGRHQALVEFLEDHPWPSW